MITAVVISVLLLSLTLSILINFTVGVPSIGRIILSTVGIFIILIFIGIWIAAIYIVFTNFILPLLGVFST